MMNRPGFTRQHGALVAHKGYYDRQGKFFLLSESVEDRIVDEICGGCLVALYQMSLSRLTELTQRSWSRAWAEGAARQVRSSTCGPSTPRTGRHV